MALESWIEHKDGTPPLNRFLDGCDAACKEYGDVMYRLIPIEDVRHPSEWSEDETEKHQRCDTISELAIDDLEAAVKMLRVCLGWLDEARMWRQVKQLNDMAIAHDLDVPIRKATE